MDTHNEWRERIWEKYADRGDERFGLVKHNNTVLNNILGDVQEVITTHSLAPKCTHCNNPFEEHHWQISHRGEHYHTGCLEKTPARVTMLIESTVAALRKEWAEKVDGMKFVDPDQAGAFAMYADRYNEALEDVLALIEPDSSN